MFNPITELTRVFAFAMGIPTGCFASLAVRHMLYCLPKSLGTGPCGEWLPACSYSRAIDWRVSAPHAPRMLYCLPKSPRAGSGCRHAATLALVCIDWRLSLPRRPPHTHPRCRICLLFGRTLCAAVLVGPTAAGALAASILLVYEIGKKASRRRSTAARAASRTRRWQPRQ